MSRIFATPGPEESPPDIFAPAGLSPSPQGSSRPAPTSRPRVSARRSVGYLPWCVGLCLTAAFLLAVTSTGGTGPQSPERNKPTRPIAQPITPLGSVTPKPRRRSVAVKRGHTDARPLRRRHRHTRSRRPPMRKRVVPNPTPATPSPDLPQPVRPRGPAPAPVPADSPPEFM